MKCGLHASVLLQSAYLLGWEEDIGENSKANSKGQEFLVGHGQDTQVFLG